MVPTVAPLYLDNETAMRVARQCLVGATLKSEINRTVDVVGTFVNPAEPRWQRTLLGAKFG